MYADRGYSAIDLRKQFVNDLVILINELQHEGHEVVLMMDANEASVRGSAVDRLILSCHLADAHALAGKTDPPRGSVKIDFVLISATLVESVKAAAILPLHDGYLSDHRELLVDFDSATLFSSKTSSVTPAVDRRLTSSNPRAVHTYADAMKKQIVRHGILEKVLELQHQSDTGQWSSECEQEWEMIDSLLAEARSASEGKCDAKRTGQLPWSPAL
jgi:hypothetical protein